MARRTKAEAEQTRHKLLDAAEALFFEHGVSRTSLHCIANAAGTTRGAIYWHFQDKAALFNAMMERVILPLEQALGEAAQDASGGCTPLGRICEALLSAFHATVHDPHTRRVLEIATHKVEYVDELRAVAERRLKALRGMVGMTEAAMRATVEAAGHTLPIPAGTAALGLHMLVDGLIINWLIDPSGFDLEAVGRATVNTYLRGLGLSRPMATTARTATASKTHDAAEPSTA